MRECFELVAALVRRYRGAVLAADEAGRILAASPNLESIAGFGSGELAGRPRSDIEGAATPEGTTIRRKDGGSIVASKEEEEILAGSVRIRFCRFSGKAVEELPQQDAKDTRREPPVTELVRSISHRFNNGLEGVVAALHAAQEAEDPKAVRACLEAAIQKIGSCRDGVVEVLKRAPGYRDAQHESDVYRPSEGRRDGRLRVLVAEDDAAIRMLVSKLLEKAGHDVTQAQDGREAIGYVSTIRFELIVTDCGMPGPGPVELIRRLRSAQPRVPLAVMSGQLFSSEEKAELRRAGADAFLAKPFRIDEFKKLIAALV
jgi:CheY-like chemotaxis protein